MSNLEQLNLDHFFDNQSVEWVNLSEVADIQKGKQFNKSDMEKEAEGLYPVINGGKTPSGYAKKYNSEANTITVSEGGASAGFVNFIESKFWLGVHAYSITPNKYLLEKYNDNYELCNRFLFNILKYHQNYLQNLKRGAAIPNLRKQILNNIKIPLINYNDLKKLIEVLDKFISLQDNLTESIAEYTKQYSYYRDLLFTEDHNLKLFEDLNLEYNQLCKVAKITKGKQLNKLDMLEKSEGLYPAINGGQNPSGYTDKYNTESNTITISEGGNSAGFVNFIESKFWLGGHAYKIEPNQSFINTYNDDYDLCNKYLFHVLKSKQRHLQNLKTGGALPNLNKGTLEKVTIPVLHYNNAKKLVKFLDKFVSLIDTLTQELEARTTQYEYYRRELFNYFNPVE